MADFVSGINPNTPAYNDPVSEAASQVRGIKKALKGTFPLFVDALNVGPTAINTYEGRIEALEDAFANLVTRKIESGIIDLGGVGTYATTGLGFTPSFLILTGSSKGRVSNTGDPDPDALDGVKVATGTYGFADGVNQHCVSMANDFRAGNSSAYESSVLLWNIYGARGVSAPNDLMSQGIFDSFDADGFTISATFNNPSTDEHRLLWTAFE